MQGTLFGAPKVEITKRRDRKHKDGHTYHYVKDETPEGIMDEVESVHKRTRFFSLFSGGKDSIGVTHWLDSIGKLEAVVHIDTGIGVTKTRDFVIETCEKNGWKLYIERPKFYRVYAAFVLEYGFPGPNFHRMVMGYLKYHVMVNFASSIAPKNHCLISGVRKFESKRRMSNYPAPINVDGSLWFAAPFFYKTSEDVYRYVHENGLKITPTHDILGYSGDCLCGSYAYRGQKEIIRDLEPGIADYIAWLEDGVKKFGTDHAKRYPTWGGKAAMSAIEEQAFIDQFFKKNSPVGGEAAGAMICGDECGPGTMRGTIDY